MQFEFSTASTIIFGSGKLNQLQGLVSDLGGQVLVISGAPSVVNDRLLSLLGNSFSEDRLVRVETEPSIDNIRTTLAIAKARSPRVIVGIGGGSTLDTAKVVAVLLTNPGDVSDYLEVVGKNQRLANPAIPLIAVPTTAGTGSEVTRNAVLGVPEHQVKVSLRSQYLLPKIALIDPELTITMPPSVTTSTGLDALTQLIEPFTSLNANPMTDALCIEGIKRVGRSFYQTFNQGTDLDAREDMSLAALFGGISLANAKLGAVHGFAGPIGGISGAHHGTVCASLLANVMEANITALSSQSTGRQILDRYAQIGKLLCDNPDASAMDGIHWIRSFCSYTGVLTLSALGITQNQFPNIIRMAQKASSMQGNPIVLTETELFNILQASL